MKLKDYIIVVVILLVIGAVGGFFLARAFYKPKTVTVELPVYNTVHDTTLQYVDKPVYKTIVKPHYITHYVAFTDSMRIIRANDSLICLLSTTGLKQPDTLKVWAKFLTAFPTNPKFVGLSLKMDTLDITTFSTGATLTTSRYPLVLESYKYRFDGKDMTVEKTAVTTAERKKLWSMSVNAYIGTDILEYAPRKYTASGEFAAQFWKIKGRLSPKITIEKHPTMGIDLKVGYQIWGR